MDRLRHLASFLPALEDPAFQAGKWAAPGESEPGVLVMPYVSLGETADRFLKSAYENGWVVSDFDWQKWSGSADARRLQNDQAALDRASEHQLEKLLTMLIRQDRFYEGSLLAAFESGLILRIVRRAVALREEQGKAAN